MQKAIITVGIPGSGKSTWARDYITKHKNTGEVNRDDIRSILFNFDHYNDYKFTRANENLVTKMANDSRDQLLKAGYDIIISDTNLNEGRRLDLIRQLETRGVEVEIQDFPIDFLTAVKRDEKRGDKTVGRQVIWNMYLRWMEYKGQKKYTPDTSLPNAFLFDIDGTIAERCPKGSNGNIRSPFDWKRVGEDAVIPHVVTVLKSLHTSGFDIVLLSGRDRVCNSETSQWLREYDIPYEALFMRAEGDCRKDSIIKEELFFNHVASRWNIIGVFDDRTAVCVGTWHKLGVPLFKVGDPVTEF